MLGATAARERSDRVYNGLGPGAKPEAGGFYGLFKGPDVASVTPFYSKTRCFLKSAMINMVAHYKLIVV